MRAKRVVDILIGSALAVCALPVIVVLAIGCAISLRTWPFFVQWRVGKNGQLFRMPKLRTLPRSAPGAVDKYALDGVPTTRFCRLLRRLHVDELPQLLMVPMGWMSLVGPRPEMPQLLDRYPSEFAAARLQVRPGCTGLWQVSESSTKLIYETPEYDLAYVHNVGLLLDAWILGRTLRMWATGWPAFGLDAVPRWAWYRWQAAPQLSFEPVVTHHRSAVSRVHIDLPELHRQEADEALRV